VKNLVMGTAGHIDHGKSALIKALTGIDPDRLKEEKERGITIELGFAYLDLSDGTRIGIVDVPGHEKFVRAMVAGAGGIDFVLLVIAADEGIMPQTKEHFEICRLLGIKRGLIALTKSDLVDAELLDIAAEEVSEYVKGSFLEGAPVVAFSATTLEGKDELIGAIEQVAKDTPERETGPFRLNVDRAFTIKGFGTVVTGTTIAGDVATGEEVMIYPARWPAKIRGIQVHGRPAEKAHAGQRTALNLVGPKVYEVERGMVVGKPNLLPTTRKADVLIEFLPNAPKLTPQRKVRFHAGTKETFARIVPLDIKLEGSQVGYAQIVLDEPTVLIGGQRFVIRSYSPITTIGGGTILNPSPNRRRRRSSNIKTILDSLATGGLEEKLLALATEAEAKGISKDLAAALIGSDPKKVEQTFDALIKREKLTLTNPQAKTAVHSKFIDSLAEQAGKHVKKYHERYPHRQGMPRAEVEEKLKPKELAAIAIDKAISSNMLVQHEKWVTLPDSAPQISDDLKRDLEILEREYKKAGTTPPTVKELSEKHSFSLKMSEMLALAVQHKKLLKVSDELYYHTDVLEEIKARLTEYLRRHESITAAQFRDTFGFSRKFAIPLLEYFDQTKLTVRLGDARVLRKHDARRS